jgi:hypothetical protein
MFAGSETVCTAPFVVVEFVSGDESLVLEEAPCSAGEATVASETAGEAAAGEQVLGGDAGLVLLAGGNAESIRHGFSSSEGPAGTTSGLVTHFLDGFASRPLLTGIEVLRQGDIGLNVLHGQLEISGHVSEGTELSLDGIDGEGIPTSVVASLLFLKR